MSERGGMSVEGRTSHWQCSRIIILCLASGTGTWAREPEFSAFHKHSPTSTILDQQRWTSLNDFAGSLGGDASRHAQLK